MTAVAALLILILVTVASTAVAGVRAWTGRGYLAPLVVATVGILGVLALAVVLSGGVAR